MYRRHHDYLFAGDNDDSRLPLHGAYGGPESQAS